MKLTVLCLFALVTLSVAVDVDLITRLRRNEKVETQTLTADSVSEHCIQQPTACQQAFLNAASQTPQETDPTEVLQGLDDWIKDFKKRTGGGDLYTSARAAVQPLVARLQRSQQQTIENIARSNREILAHVEEAATNHIYNLLRASKVRSDKSANKEEHAAEVKELKRELEEKQEMLKAAESNAKKGGAAGSSSSASNLASIAANEEKKLEQEVKKELQKKF